MQSGCFVCVCAYVGPFGPAFSSPGPIRSLDLCVVSSFFFRGRLFGVCVYGDGAKGKTLTVRRLFSQAT